MHQILIITTKRGTITCFFLMCLLISSVAFGDKVGQPPEEHNTMLAENEKALIGELEQNVIKGRPNQHTIDSLAEIGERVVPRLIVAFCDKNLGIHQAAEKTLVKNVL